MKRILALFECCRISHPKRWGVVGLVILMFFASSVWAASHSGDAKLDQAIEKANADWAAAMKTGDAATIAAAYGDDGVFVGLDGSLIKGRAEIEKMYGARFERAGFAVSTKIESHSVVLDGDLGYETGYGEIGTKSNGETIVRGARYLTVWQRRDGDWKILRNLVLP